MQFQLLSLNMRVYAAQIGQEGASLAVVAQNFQELVSSIQAYLQKFSADADVLSQHIQNFTIMISSLKLLIDIVDFFIQESLTHISSQVVVQKDAFHDLQIHSELFTQLSDQFIVEFSKVKLLAQESVNHFDQANRDIRKFVNGIELVSQIGSVESTRLSDGGKDFKHDIDSMIKFSENLRASAAVISSAAKDLSANLNKYDAGITLAEKSMKSIFSVALNLEKLQV
jgi:methyl-accepting chemotaxis protein